MQGTFLNSNRQQGFTLIELSIVLVIIGLIVGGVLVGRDLIEAARVRSQIKQINDFSTATNIFKTKYNGLPGDISQAQAASFGFSMHAVWGGDTPHTNDGYINNADGILPIQNNSNEPWAFSYDLRDAGLMPFKLETTYVASQISFYPPAAINPATGILVSGYKDGNWLYFGKTADYNGGFIGGHCPPGTGSFSPAQAYAADSKIDDGIPSSGAVIMVDDITLLPTTDNTPSQCVTNSSGNVYNVTDSKTWCKPFVKLR